MPRRMRIKRRIKKLLSFDTVLSRISHLFSSLGRLRRSRGFGVHSPFAFRFVLNVMCQKHGYYAYKTIEHLHFYATRLARHKPWRSDVMPLCEAKALFRIVNYYNPRHLLHLGSTAGLSVAVTALASSKSKHLLYVQGAQCTDMLTSCAERVNREQTIHSAAEHYAQIIAESGEKSFVTIDLKEAEPEAEAVVRHAVDNGGVIVFCNTAKGSESQRLSDMCRSYAGRGMWFGNNHLGVMVANPKLPRQDFMLWL